MCWIRKNCSRDVLHVGKSWEMYWMIEKSVRDVLNIRKLMNELCWKWENFVTDVLNQKKIIQELYCMWENYERCIKWDKKMQEMR